MAHPRTAIAPAGRLRAAGLALALVWAAFWLLFGLASGLGEGIEVAGVVAHTVMPGGVFLAAALIAWRWQAAGALLLVGAASLAEGYYPFARTLEGFAIIVLPGLAAGVVLLADMAIRRRR